MVTGVIILVVIIAAAEAVLGIVSSAYDDGCSSYTDFVVLIVPVEVTKATALEV